MHAGLSAAMWLAAGLLAWAGVAKIVRPHVTQAALRQARLPSSRPAARSLGAGETLIASAALAFGGPLAAPLAAAYAALALFSQHQRRRPQASCGCFGDVEAPLTALHVTVNAVAALLAGAAAIVDAPGVVTATASRPGLLLATVLLIVSGSSLVMQLLTTVPTLTAQMSATSGGSR